MQGRVLAGVTGIIAASVALVTSAPVVNAETSGVDFESPAYALGDINGQDGWVKTGPYDVAVDNSAGVAGFGGQSLRISNAVTSTSFGDQTFSKEVVDEAGELTADDDGGAGARQSVFDASWQFASTLPGAEQPGLAVTASPDRGDGARMSWIQMTDTPSGLGVNFFDYQRDIDPTCEGLGDDPFVFTPVVSGLDRAVPHTLRVVMTFVDGPANDVVDIYVDGVLEHTGTSWEDYFRDCEGNPTRTVDSILFRASGTAAPATSGSGFLLDNLSITTDTPAPPVVDDDGMGAAGDCDATDPASTSIQASIDDALAGGTITVCPGTYTEQLSIDHDITLDGIDEDGVIVKAPAVLSSGAVAGQFSIVEVTDGATLTVNELTVSGPGPTGCGSLHYGILAVGGATVDADTITVADVRDQPLSGCQNGRAIQAGRTEVGAGPGHLVGTNLTVVGFQKNGIDTRGAGSTIAVTDSVITGAGATPAIAQNGVVIFSGATGTVSGSSISGLRCDNANCGPDVDDDAQSAGVTVLSTGGATITDNEVTDTDIGVYVDTVSTPVTVSGNEISSARRAGVYTSAAETTVSGNAIVGGGIGVYAVAYDGATAHTLTHVVGNAIAGNTTGLLARDFQTADASVAALDAAVNRIVDNGTGASEGAGGVVSAPDNWWGCQSGPGTAGCDSTSGGVDVLGHWLVLKIARSTATTSSTAQITLDLTTNNVGQDRSSVGHVPDGTPATFTTTKGSIVSPVGTVNGKAVTTLSATGAAGKATVTGTIDNGSVSTTVTLTKPKLSILASTAITEDTGGTTVVPFTIKLSAAAATNVTVHYQTIDGTAKASAGDYVATSGTATILAGSTTTVVPVTVNGDSLDELNESFTFKLTSPVGATGTPSKALRINDDDATPTLSVTNVTAPEGTTAAFTVTLSAASGRTVTVKYATSNGNTSAADFQAANGTLTFLPGDTIKQVNVPVHFDGKDEVAETFKLKLAGPTAATISDGLGIGTIPANVS